MGEKERRQKDILKAGIAGASYETVQRYGSAVKEHYVAFSGKDYENNKNLMKGLRQISEQKINPDYEYQNIHQQAGFSAEVKEVARYNAEKIINGDRTRKIRTDDMGKINDPLYDTFIIDEYGNIVENSGAQMKFLGASAKNPEGNENVARSLKKLQSVKFKKYLDNNVKIDVPSEQYQEMQRLAENKIDNLSKQLQKQRAGSNTELVLELENQIETLKKIRKSLRESSVSSNEAVFARKHPTLSTTADVAKISGRAGLKTGIQAATITGSVSIIKNLVAVYKGEKEPEEAICNVVGDTVKRAESGFTTGFTGSMLKGAMQNSKSQYMRTLSETNIAGTVVLAATSFANTLICYFNGEIDGVECLETLGEQGTGMISSTMFSVIGQAAIPIPIVGAMIGGMVGYALSSASYGILMQALKEEKIVRDQRIEIEEVCKEQMKMIRQYRTELEEIINQYLVESMNIFRESFTKIKDAFVHGDVDWFIESANGITENLGAESSFTSMRDFDCKMVSGNLFKL